MTRAESRWIYKMGIWNRAKEPYELKTKVQFIDNEMLESLTESIDISNFKRGITPYNITIYVTNFLQWWSLSIVNCVHDIPLRANNVVNFT